MIIIINVGIMIHENDNGCADDDDDDVYSDGFIKFSILKLGCDICTFSM